MRLDFLQNHPLNPKANQILIDQTYPNPSPLDPKELQKLHNESKELAKIFGGNEAYGFGFGCGDWLELFIRLQKHHNIAYALSSHQQGYEATKLLSKPIYKLIPEKSTAQIQSQEILRAIHSGCDCFIIPFVNEDILSLNPIVEIKSLLETHLKDFKLIIDISYMISSHQILPDILDSHTLFLINAEALGVLRGNGVMIAKDFSHPEILNKTLFPQNLFSAFNAAFKNLSPQKNNNKIDKKIIFYETLKGYLGDQISLFAPLENSLPHTLALRFSSIKARYLLQSLMLQKIYAINGLACLYGLSTPSFVLQEMGYSQLESRELLSISFEDLKDTESFCKILSQSYLQIKNLELP